MDADLLARRVVDAMVAAEGTDWGIELLDIRHHYARIAMTVLPSMINAHATIHGGMTFALADSALAYASNSTNERAVVAHASMVFLTPAHLGEQLIAEAQLRVSEGRAQVYAVTVTTSDGRAVAEFTGHTRTVGGAILES